MDIQPESVAAHKGLTRRQMLGRTGAAAIATAVIMPMDASFQRLFAQTTQTAEVSNALAAIGGPARIVMTHGKTYLNGWVGYGAPPRPGRRRGRGNAPETPPPEPPGPPPTARWEKLSGPGTVTFADGSAVSTTATFSAAGDYELQITADNGTNRATSTVAVHVEPPPPPVALTPIMTGPHSVSGPLWSQRTKVIIVSWLPHCAAQLNRTDLTVGAGGLDNFDEAAKALRGEPHGPHKGYVFSNAYVHNAVESMSFALMIDPQGDPEIIAAQEQMRAMLDDWIPRILAAQYPDGYLQTAFTLRDPAKWPDRWTPQGRGNHEGYTGGYFIESALAHYTMTGHKDARLYHAARRLADCWDAHIGPAPKQEWFDGHQEMEQALVRLGRFVNEHEGAGKGDRYIALAKFLLDCRHGGTEYDQSHLPVVQQYEAVGHAVRAAYTYSGMAAVAMETRDVDYQSAVRSLWDDIVNRKYYVTGGIGSGETSEGFGPDYSLRNNSYCESCSSCGEIFFQWKMNLTYHDAAYADLYEETLYNALLGALDQQGANFYYTNPLDENAFRAAWHSVPCCTGNIPRTLLQLPSWTYALGGSDSLYVNLYAGSTITIPKIAGTAVVMTQTTNYPWDGKVRIELAPSHSKRFALFLRAPRRDVSALYSSSPAADGITAIHVNGRPVNFTVANGYASVVRTWRRGDTVELELPMQVQRVLPSDRIAADTGRIALRYGPLMYNIEKVDQDIEGALDTTSALTPEWRPDLLGGVVVIEGQFAGGSPLFAVPYFTRYNRNGPPPPPPPRQPAPPPGTPPVRRPPPPATAIVWMKKA